MRLRESVFRWTKSDAPSVVFLLDLTCPCILTYSLSCYSTVIYRVVYYTTARLTVCHLRFVIGRFNISDRTDNERTELKLCKDKLSVFFFNRATMR